MVHFCTLEGRGWIVPFYSVLDCGFTLRTRSGLGAGQGSDGLTLYWGNCRAANNFFHLKGHCPTKTPSWPDKTKLWSDIIKNKRLNFISLKLPSYHFPRDLFALLLLITINSKIYHFTLLEKKTVGLHSSSFFTQYCCCGRNNWAILLCYWSLKISF